MIKNDTLERIQKEVTILSLPHCENPEKSLFLKKNRIFDQNDNLLLKFVDFFQQIWENILNLEKSSILPPKSGLNLWS